MKRTAILLVLLAVASGAMLFGSRRAGSEEPKANDSSILTLRGHKDWVSSVAFSPDGKRIVSGSADDTVRIRDSHSGKELLILHGKGKGITCLAISPDGKRIVGGNWNGTLTIWDEQRGKELARLCGHRESITSVAFSPDGKRIVSGSADDTLKVWDAQNGKKLLTLDHGNEYDITCVAFSPDGERIVSGDGENLLNVWDSRSGEELLTLEGHDAAITGVAFSPDGKRIVSGSRDSSLLVWDSRSGKALLALRGHGDEITAVAFSPDGKCIVSGSDDKTLKVWDAPSGKSLLTLRGHRDNVTSVAFSPDGKRIVSGSKNCLKVWEAIAKKAPHDDDETTRAKARPSAGRVDGPKAVATERNRLTVLVMLKKKTHPFVKYLEENYRVKLSFAVPERGAGIPGVQAVDKCDVILLSQRRQDTTPEQTAILKKALLKDHKGIVGIRQASHAFNRWPEIDREIFGATYRGHFFESKDRQFVRVEDKAKKDPLIDGFIPFVCNGYLYRYTDVAPDVEVLMAGGLPDKIQPVTWRRITKEGLRVFYTRYDEADLQKSEDCRRMVSRALFWAAGQDVEKYRTRHDLRKRANEQ